MEKALDFIFSNISWIAFLVFMLIGVFSKNDNKKKPTTQQKRPASDQRPSSSQEADTRPLAERLAEAFGAELVPQSSPNAPQPRTSQRERRPSTFASDDRRLEEEYGWGGGSLFDDKSDDFGGSRTKWGFDETEWGSTFDKNEEQYGNSFPERKSSEPIIEFPR